MPDRSRIPRNDGEFDAYIKSSTAYLLLNAAPVNWERLGLIQAEMDEWEQYKNDWIPLYAKQVDLTQRTPTVTHDKNLLKENFTEFASPLLNRMSFSGNIITADRDNLHIQARDMVPTERAVIEDEPYVKLSSRPGGRMQIRCRIDEDSDNASMHPDADGVEVKIKIGAADAAAPASPNDCSLQVLSSKAKFNYEAGVENAGKRMWIFCRYVNITNAANNGPYSDVHTAIIQ
jgi:hypothetical protein